MDNFETVEYDYKTKNHHWGLIILVIVILVLVILYIRRRNDNEDEDENEAFGPFRTACTTCGTLGSYDCNNCVNCGYCTTIDGRAGCVPGDAQGPLNNSLNCISYRYNGRVVPPLSYNPAVINPAVLNPAILTPALSPIRYPQTYPYDPYNSYANRLYAYDRRRFGNNGRRSWDWDNRRRSRSWDWDDRNRSRSWDNSSQISNNSGRSVRTNGLRSNRG